MFLFCFILLALITKTKVSGAAGMLVKIIKPIIKNINTMKKRNFEVVWNRGHSLIGCHQVTSLTIALMTFIKFKFYNLLTLVLLLVITSCGSSKPPLRAKLVNETPTSTVFSPDGKWVAAGVWGGVRVWNVDSEEAKDYKTKLRNETPKYVTFSPDGKRIAAGSWGAVRVWDLKSAELKDYPVGMINETPTHVFFSPDGTWMATGIFGAVRTWDLATGAHRDYPMKMINETPQMIAISADGKTIATGVFGGVMKWEFKGFDN
ncbi:hypothetical protein DSL64_21855 [Dyadobacter luteus]|uniref:WD40 repeat domain-containing protein n=2 Tax=Dyadobacter luteus TaxID=2259619 RepID=A0A3D8Y6T1_9BACT|nr:hypothetical protein DSL64_21855 [Dyadobacter luteus]